MKQFILYFIFGFGIVAVFAIWNLEIYGLLVLIAIATIKLLMKLLSVDKVKIIYLVTAIMTYILIAIMYGCIYYLLPGKHIYPYFERSTDGVLSAIYFSFSTITTLGYGDFKPITALSRLIVTSQLIVGLLIVAIGINYVYNKTKDSK